ncbi:MAG: lysine--tRNA ligase [Acidobacteria bacterium]|nr:MAG: lysine--tRNA ligase [Acidobacteriota bacterium]
MPFENEYMEQRHQNRLEIEEMGIQPYPVQSKRTHTIAELLSAFTGKSKEELEAEKVEVAIVGRLMLKRDMGKASFVHLQDGSGRIQIYIRKNDVGDAQFNLYKKIDLGDFFAVRGHLFKTRTQELTVYVKELTFLSKAYRPLPEKFHGLTDTETRYRQRYLDLIANPEVKETFQMRSKIIQAVRTFMHDRDYLEVETPMMHPIPGGAAAKPFITHHNTLDMDLYLRIAPELYLKRLIIGGMERVFEINRNFRNEGISKQHNPEFSMMEWYQAYADLRVMMEMTESLVKYVIDQVHDTKMLPYGEHVLNFQVPFVKMTLREAICKYSSHTMEQLNHPEELIEIAKTLNIEDPEKIPYGYLLTEVFEQIAEPHLIQPTFITEYPVEVSPLTKLIPGQDQFVDRFEFYMAGMELANAYSELNDPIDQRARFKDQLEQRERGDDEAQVFDEDFLTAIEHGMPPTGGEGLGIDRLVMILTNSQTIRDVILFPQMRTVD